MSPNGTEQPAAASPERQHQSHFTQTLAFTGTSIDPDFSSPGQAAQRAMTSSTGDTGVRVIARGGRGGQPAAGARGMRARLLDPSPVTGSQPLLAGLLLQSVGISVTPD